MTSDGCYLPTAPLADRELSPRSGLAGQLVVFGGEDSPRNAFDPRLWVFSAGPKARLGKVEGWRAHAAAPPPAPLLGHATAAVGNIPLLASPDSEPLFRV